VAWFIFGHFWVTDRRAEAAAVEGRTRRRGAWRVTPGGLLPGAQALPGIGDRIVGLQPLLGSVEQMHTPGLGIAVLLRGQEVAIGRFGADAGQNRLSDVKKFIVQPCANARQVLRARSITTGSNATSDLL
jgi:hypothetical protein